MVKKMRQMWVDETIHKKLKSEAAKAGMSLKDYLATKVSDDVTTIKKDYKRFKGVF